MNEYVLAAFVREAALLLKTAKAEYAPGIPSKEAVHDLPTITKPTKWEFGVHRHDAKRRGLHFDLRLGDPKTGHAHSWAFPAEWPKPGKHLWAIQQPTHTLPYMDFEGTLPAGYGAGKVTLHDRDKVEVTKAEPGYISYNVYRSTGPEEYSLRHIGGKVWRFGNKTLHRGELPHLPDSKPDYKEVPVSKIPMEDSKYVMSAKIDDAHNLFVFPRTGKQVRVFSYRAAKRSPTGLIEHTHKVRSLLGAMVPKELSGAVIRGGLYAMHPKTSKATDAHILGGMLNSNVWKSRETQKEHGQLVPIIYDVVKFKGKDVSKAPYSEKLQILKTVQKHLPQFELPQMATTTQGKKQLLKQIENKKLPHTEEGVVLWNTETGEPPIKAKFKGENDVFIRGFFPGEGKYKGSGVGGFVYSHEKDGPIVGRVGTGLSDAQRKHMHKNPEKYLGLVAKVESRGRFDKSQSLRAPAFKEFHLDKNEQTRLDAIHL